MGEGEVGHACALVTYYGLTEMLRRGGVGGRSRNGQV